MSMIVKQYRKCDVCGKEYEEKEVEKHINEEPLPCKISNSDGTQYFDGYGAYDLCEDCEVAY